LSRQALSSCHSWRSTPVAFSVGPFEVRWYALAYILGFLCNWAYAHALVRTDRLWGNTPHPTPESMADLVLYSMLGTLIGGKLGSSKGFYSKPIRIEVFDE